ncbi:MAG: glycosyltransferase family A protein, partial [Patescibacteria group bacterium]
MRFSIIIPTYNRKEKLTECIKALSTQDFKKSEFEVLVIDDGGIDNTENLIEKLQKSVPMVIRYFRQENQGQGVARNTGIKEAFGEITLLLGDDIIATNGLLKEHDRIHKQHTEENAAVLGFTHPIDWLGGAPGADATRLVDSDVSFLRQVARLTWRYFEVFVGPQENWLAPANFQEVPG